MGTYSRPGTGVSPYMIDRSAELISKELDTAGTDLINQKENIRISQNKGAEQIAELERSINSAEGGAGLTFKDKSIDMFNTETDNLDLLMRNSIGRDQTDYIKAKSNLMSASDQFTKILTILDAESDEYTGIVDPQRQILNSTDKAARGFMDNIKYKNGENITPTYKDGNLILTYNGPEGEFVLNANNYITARDNGAGQLINYSKIEEHEKEWDTLVDNTIKNSNLKPESIKSIENIKGGKINTKTVEDYTVAKESLTKRLLENTNLLPTLDESTWQFFHPGEEWNPKFDTNKLKGEVVEYLVNQKLGLDEVVTSQVESFKKSQGGPGEGEGDEVKKPKHSTFISGLDDINQLINAPKDAQSPGFDAALRKRRMDKVYDYMRKYPNIVTGDNKDVKSYDKQANPNDLYIIKQSPQTKRKFYEILDINNIFTDDVFNDPDMMERTIQMYVQPTDRFSANSNVL